MRLLHCKNDFSQLPINGSEREVKPSTEVVQEEQNNEVVRQVSIHVILYFSRKV